jgi:hypothetical protein
MRLLERSDVSDVGVSLFSVSQFGVHTKLDCLNKPATTPYIPSYSQANGTRVTSSETAGERDSGQRRWPVVGTGSGEVK